MIEVSQRYSIQWQYGRDSIRTVNGALFLGVSGACSSGKIFEIENLRCNLVYSGHWIPY